MKRVQRFNGRVRDERAWDERRGSGFRVQKEEDEMSEKTGKRERPWRDGTMKRISGEEAFSLLEDGKETELCKRLGIRGPLSRPYRNRTTEVPDQGGREMEGDRILPADAAIEFAERTGMVPKGVVFSHQATDGAEAAEMKEEARKERRK